MLHGAPSIGGSRHEKTPRNFWRGVFVGLSAYGMVVEWRVVVVVVEVTGVTEVAGMVVVVTEVDAAGMVAVIEDAEAAGVPVFRQARQGPGRFSR